jgi:putative endonuclease
MGNGARHDSFLNGLGLQCAFFVYETLLTQFRDELSPVIQSLSPFGHSGSPRITNFRGRLLAGIQKYVMTKQPAVYILSSKRNGTLYVGVTSDLVKRVWEHRNNLVEGFSKRYNVHQLVWYELHESMDSAINREKRLKDWKRKWKLQLIEKTNPNWDDLYSKII